MLQPSSARKGRMGCCASNRCCAPPSPPSTPDNSSGNGIKTGSALTSRAPRSPAEISRSSVAEGISAKELSTANAPSCKVCADVEGGSASTPLLLWGATASASEGFSAGALSGAEVALQCALALVFAEVAPARARVPLSWPISWREYSTSFSLAESGTLLFGCWATASCRSVVIGTGGAPRW